MTGGALLIVFGIIAIAIAIYAFYKGDGIEIAGIFGVLLGLLWIICGGLLIDEASVSTPISQNSIYCIQCGDSIEQDYIYCPECGAKIVFPD